MATMTQRVDPRTVRDGNYWLRWAETPVGQEPSDEEVYMAQVALRDQGLRLCNDDEGMLVTTTNDVA